MRITRKIKFEWQQKKHNFTLPMRLNDFFESKLLVEMRVCFAIYKLAQGENLLMCFELFVIGKPLSHLFFESLLKLSTFSILKNDQMVKMCGCGISHD